jgi:cold shock CspA family protein
MSGVVDVEFDSLTEGQAVDFEVEKNQKGSRNKGPRAINVKLAD